MNRLNCGCGQRFHPDWINIDSVSHHRKEVFAYDLRQGIPYPDESFNVVYHSHFIEHLTKSEGVLFIQECFRVLKSGGILRVVVPDLEQIVRGYLFALEQACAGSKEWMVNYEWMMLELYDQTVRHASGGEMFTYLSCESVLNKEFIIARIGQECYKIIENISNRKRYAVRKFGEGDRLYNYMKKVSSLLSWKCWRERIIKNILREEYSMLQIGRFRNRGEVHNWMYDRYSLRVLLEGCNFKEITSQKATESMIYDWGSFFLDADQDGLAYKPDSLYMEGIK